MKQKGQLDGTLKVKEKEQVEVFDKLDEFHRSKLKRIRLMTNSVTNGATLTLYITQAAGYSL